MRGCPCHSWNTWAGLGVTTGPARVGGEGWKTDPSSAPTQGLAGAGAGDRRGEGCPRPARAAPTPTPFQLLLGNADRPGRNPVYLAAPFPPLLVDAIIY